MLIASVAAKTEQVLTVHPVILRMYPTDGGDGRNIRMLGNKRIYDARMCAPTVHYLIQPEYTAIMNVKIYYKGRKTLHKTFPSLLLRTSVSDPSSCHSEDIIPYTRLQLLQNTPTT